MSPVVGLVDVCCCGPFFFGGGRCAVAPCRSVLPACASSFCVVACCVGRARWRRAGGVALPRAASGGCRVVLPAPPLGRFARGFFFCLSVSAGCAPPPPAGFGALSCALFCVLFSGAVVRGVFGVVPGVVWRACVGLGSRVVLFGAVLCWVLLCCFCCVLLSCAAAFSAGLFFALFLAFPWCSGLVLFLCSACAMLCSCACVVALCAVLSCPCGAGWCFMLLPVVFVALLLGLAVLCCLLVGPDGSWCGVSVVCCGVSWVLCCAVLLRGVPPGVVLLWAVLFYFALFGAVARFVVSWGAVRRPGVLCLSMLSFVLSPCAVCVLLWGVAVWCCSPLCFVPCASWDVVLCVPCLLRPVRCCCAALLSLGALLPCAVPRGAVLSCGAVVSFSAALFGLFPVFVWFLLLKKQLQNLLEYFFLKTKFNYTPPNAPTLAQLKSARPCPLHCLTCHPAMVAVSWMVSPWWLRCPGRDATYGPPAVKRRQKRQELGTGGRGGYMMNQRGREGARAGAWRVTKIFFRVLRVAQHGFSLRKRRVRQRGARRYVPINLTALLLSI